MISQIMKTIHLDRAEATTMAFRMLVTQLLMVTEMPAGMLSESHGAA
jgi:hypothetical protein